MSAKNLKKAGKQDRGDAGKKDRIGKAELLLTEHKSELRDAIIDDALDRAEARIAEAKRKASKARK